MTTATSHLISYGKERMRELGPGLVLAGLVAMSAQFVAEHSQAPAMLMALLFGMVISFVHETDPQVRAGVEFSAKRVLKFGIVLLGARMSAQVAFALGWQSVCLVVFALLTTMAFGLIVARLLGLSRDFAILTAGAVSICGASAALAISAVLPKTKDSDKQLFVTIVGVTALSTVAMIIYPVLLSYFAVSDPLVGRIIGATIHDVAQVVGAGYSVSDTAGDSATLVKLVRVSMLAPFVLILGLLMRRQSAQKSERTTRPPIVPVFVIGFILMAVLNSIGWIPDWMKSPIETLSKAALLMAIAAVGIKSNLREMASIGYAPIALLVLETIIIVVVAATGLLLIGL